MYLFSELPEIGEEYRVQFPHPREADAEGILGQGGNLSPGVLLSAYEQGIFPWYMPETPILWWSPDPRCVIFLSDFHMSRRSRRALNKKNYRFSADQHFELVIRSCATVGRENGTWISNEMIQAYCELHRLGYAHSVEVLEDDELVGGLYGVSRGNIFFGESMFSHHSGASTWALAALVNFLQFQNVALIDSQVANSHIEGMGGRTIPRKDYLQYLADALKNPPIGDWQSLSL